MRIRQVKPSFWGDAKIASLPHDARLFYIGLWMLADDDGWLRWDVAEIGQQLYGFEDRAAREQQIAVMADALSQALPGKVTFYDCGHAELPRLAVHQHLAGSTRRVTTVHTEHSRDCPQIPATPRPVLVSEGEVMVSEGNGQGSARESATETTGLKTWHQIGEVLRKVAHG